MLDVSPALLDDCERSLCCTYATIAKYTVAITAVVGCRNSKAPRMRTAVAASEKMVTTVISMPCTMLVGPRSIPLYRSVTDESTRSFHDFPIRTLKFDVPIRTSSSANLLMETHEISVEQTVRKLKSAITDNRILPPELISMDSPPEDAVKTCDTKYRAVPSRPESSIKPNP